MIKHLFILFTISLFFSCDVKKSSVSGKVVDAVTGVGVGGALVNFIQCKTTDENCTEIVIGQIYTNDAGEFNITQKQASKSKKKWLTVYKNNKKLAQKDNIGLNDNNIIIQVIP